MTALARRKIGIWACAAGLVASAAQVLMVVVVATAGSANGVSALVLYITAPIVALLLIGVWQSYLRTLHDRTRRHGVLERGIERRAMVGLFSYVVLGTGLFLAFALFPRARLVGAVIGVGAFGTGLLVLLRRAPSKPSTAEVSRDGFQ